MAAATQGPFTQRHIFFENAHFQNRTRKENAFTQSRIQTDTLEMTKNNVVPMPGPVWPHNISTTENRKKDHS